MDYLVHYGVKGMKWGVRHDNNQSSTSSGSKPSVDDPVYRRDAVKKTFRMLDKDMDGIKTNGVKPGHGTKKEALERQKRSMQHEYDHLKYRDGSKEVLDIAKKWKLDGDLLSRRDPSQFTMAEKRTSKEAKKDAEEFARAKAFYGEGAGNRRKAIKTTVEAKTKKDDFYGLEFEYHLSKQDMQKHMTEATAERHRKDGQKKAEQAGRKIERGLRFASRFL